MTPHAPLLFVASERKVSSIPPDGTEKSVFVVNPLAPHAAVSSSRYLCKRTEYSRFTVAPSMYAKDARSAHCPYLVKVTATLVTPYLSETTYNAVNRALRDGNYNGPFNFAVTWTNPVNTSKRGVLISGKNHHHMLLADVCRRFLEGQGPPWGFNVSYSPYYDYGLLWYRNENTDHFFI